MNDNLTNGIELYSIWQKLGTIMDVLTPNQLTHQVKELIRAYESLRRDHEALQVQYADSIKRRDDAKQQIRQMIQRLKMIEDQA